MKHVTAGMGIIILGIRIYKILIPRMIIPIPAVKYLTSIPLPGSATVYCLLMRHFRRALSADRRVSLAHYGDYRRAWQGVRMRYTSDGRDDPTSHSDPTLIQPHEKVGSPHQEALNGISDPTDPTSVEKNFGEAVAPYHAEVCSNRVLLDQVGSEGLFSASWCGDPTSFQRLDQVGSGWITAEVGSPVYRTAGERCRNAPIPPLPRPDAAKAAD